MRHPGDGDGWIECACGSRHWGLHGAAGLLLLHEGAVLLQHRAEWSHHGGTWGVPGGARSSHEDPVSAALREAAEEAGIDPALVQVNAAFVDDHGPWSYTTVLAEALGPVHAAPTDPESLAVVWVPVDDVPRLALHPAFAARWPVLDAAQGRRLVVVVDVANAMGSRPDGWWRDRAGAAARLLRELAPLRRGIGAGPIVPPGTPPELTWHPDVVAVVEGAARSVPAPDGVEVVRAVASGDDALVEHVERRRAYRPGDPVVVVTADRELRRRVAARGAYAVGPTALPGLRPAERA